MNDMPTHHSKLMLPCVRYFYLPASNGRHAEIIVVLYSGSTRVQVPMREEDVTLRAFFERTLTPEEAQACKGDQTWKVFDSWEELQQDHNEHGVAHEALEALQDGLARLSPIEEAVV
ncbi:hypothetical protein [Pontibacter ummariensis]|nr:hypothetical protein [Pontibacter ummariensis]